MQDDKCPSYGTIRRFSAGSLDPQEKSNCEEHVRNCPLCQNTQNIISRLNVIHTDIYSLAGECPKQNF
jgi:hypothetical protein